MKKSIEQSIGNDQVVMLVLAIILAATALWAIGCGGKGGSDSAATPTTPSSPPSGSGAIGATITIASTGLSSSTPRHNFRGQVLVGLSSTDPAPPDPNYVR